MTSSTSRMGTPSNRATKNRCARYKIAPPRSQSPQVNSKIPNLVVKLAESVGPRMILCAESVFVDHSRLIKIVKFFDFGIEFFAFGFEHFQKLSLGIG